MKRTYYLLIFTLASFCGLAQPSIQGPVSGVCPGESVTYSLNVPGYCPSVTSLDCTACYDKEVSADLKTITLKWQPGGYHAVTAEVFCYTMDPQNQTIQQPVTVDDAQTELFSCVSETTAEYVDYTAS